MLTKETKNKQTENLTDKEERKMDIISNTIIDLIQSNPDKFLLMKFEKKTNLIKRQ